MRGHFYIHGSHTPTSPEAVLLHSSLLGAIKLRQTLYSQSFLRKVRDNTLGMK